MIHLTTQQLSTHLDGELSEASEATAREHLASCAECAAKLAKLEEQERSLAGALRSEPDEAFFGRMTASLTDRTRSAARPAPRHETEMPPTRRRKGASFPWGAVIIIASIVASLGAVNFGMEYVPRWLTSSGNGERLLQAAGGNVPAPNGDALAEPTAGPGEAPAEGTAPAGQGSAADDRWSDGEPIVPVRPGPAPTASRAIPPPAPSSPEPPFPTPGKHASAESRIPISEAALGARRTQSPADDPAAAPQSGGKAAAGSAWTPVIPAAPPAPVEAPRAAPKDSSGADKDSLILIEAGAAGTVKKAQRLDEEAEANPSVSAYEASAAEWERALGLLHGDGYREARLRLAEARYRVWQLEPNGERAAMAAAAIRAYLVDAPPGPDRGKMTRRLLEVEENRYR